MSGDERGDNAFMSQLPPGWGLVPLAGPHMEPREPAPPDHRTLVSNAPSFPTTLTRADQQGAMAAKGHSRLMVDERVIASKRRHVKEPVQLAWDRDTDAAYMLACAAGEKGLAAVIPLGRIMEQLKITIAGRVGGFDRVDQNMAQAALKTAARVFAQGDIEWTIRLMAPIHSLVTRRPGPEGMLEFLATFLRDLFPSAPQSYIPPERRVKQITAQGVPGTPVLAAPRLPTKGDKQVQAARKVVAQAPPDLEKVKLMSPQRARLMLPAMREALQGYEGPDREKFTQAIDIMKEIGERLT